MFSRLIEAPISIEAIKTHADNPSTLKNNQPTINQNIEKKIDLDDRSNSNNSANKIDDIKGTAFQKKTNNRVNNAPNPQKSTLLKDAESFSSSLNKINSSQSTATGCITLPTESITATTFSTTDCKGTTVTRSSSNNSELRQREYQQENSDTDDASYVSSTFKDI